MNVTAASANRPRLLLPKTGVNRMASSKDRKSNRSGRE
jgi:hypothetical protein